MRRLDGRAVATTGFGNDYLMQTKSKWAAASACLSTVLLTSACAVTPREQSIPTPPGPPIVSNLVTPFDEALQCLADTTPKATRKKMILGVGEIADLTGKEQMTDGGSGKFVSQGLGDVLQSALVEAGAVVVNRRDMRVLVFDRDRAKLPYGIVPTTHHFTGSINRLDFFPGGALQVGVDGISGGVRQYRVMVGMNIALTDTRTGEVQKVEALDKQVVGDEVKAGVGRFFGSSLVEVGATAGSREPLQFVGGQMVKLAGYNILKDIWKNDSCDHLLDRLYKPDGALPDSQKKKPSPDLTAAIDKSTAANTAGKSDLKLPPPAQPEVTRKPLPPAGARKAAG